MWYQELGGFTTWATSDNVPSNNNEEVACKQLRWRAIQADERFGSVLSVLRSRGFDIGDLSDPDALGHAVETEPRFAPPLDQRLDRVVRNRLVWDDVMQQRVVETWESMIYGPAKAHFPKVRGQNWKYGKFSSSLCVPDEDGWLGCRVANSTGYVPGGDTNGFSTSVMYNSFAQTPALPPSYEVHPSVPGTLKEFFGLSTSYNATAFNVLRLFTYQARMMVLGGIESGAQTPVKPWIAFQTYGETFSDVDSMEYYQEFLLQLGASGVGQFLVRPHIVSFRSLRS